MNNFNRAYHVSPYNFNKLDKVLSSTESKDRLDKFKMTFISLGDISPYEISCIMKQLPKSDRLTFTEFYFKSTQWIYVVREMVFQLDQNEADQYDTRK